MSRLLVVGLLVCGCSNLVVVRGSTNDFLQPKATSVTLNAPARQVQERLDELMDRRGFRPALSQAGENGTQVVIYKGSRRVPREAASFGVELGSWFAARLGSVEGSTDTELWMMGKPMVGKLEVCSDHDKLLADIGYTCDDTRVPPDWAGKNLVSGRDETEVVTDVLSRMYERLRQ